MCDSSEPVTRAIQPLRKDLCCLFRSSETPGSPFQFTWLLSNSFAETVYKVPIAMEMRGPVAFNN